MILLIIFFLPFNLFLKINLNSSIINGNVIDYLLPKIYLTDLLIFLLIFFSLKKGLFALNKKSLKKIFFNNSVLIILISLLILYQFVTKNQIASILYLVKIIEMYVLFLILKKEKIPKNIINKIINLSLLFQSLLGIYQFHFQKSLLPFYFLGETKLKTDLTISMGKFFGTKLILPYGSTAHTNILAGVLVIYWLLLLKQTLVQKRKKTNYVFGITTIISFYCLFLTQSLSAFLALIIGIVIILCNSMSILLKKSFFIFIFSVAIIPILIFFVAKARPTILSLSRRQKLNQSTLKIITKHPLLGVGLNNFTDRVGEYYQDSLTPTFIQPVHHLGLLILAETGFVGFLTMLIILKKNWNKKLAKLLFIFLPIITLDHYLLTNQVGLLLFTMSLVLF